MTKQIGLWIDHKKAVIVVLTDKGVEIKKIESDDKKHVRFRGGARAKTPYGAQFFTAETQIDRQHTEHLNKYYGDVIASIRDADSILICGPGEAKLELQKRLTHERLSKKIGAIKALDKITERQLVATVRKHFEAQPA
jgi:stalled ribosome rescue protein Dom34